MERFTVVTISDSSSLFTLLSTDTVCQLPQVRKTQNSTNRSYLLKYLQQARFYQHRTLLR